MQESAMTPPSTGELCRALANLTAGQRAWFWFSPEAEQGGTSPLAISPLATDPLMKQLKRKVDTVELPLGARQAAGLLSVTADGRLQFGGSSLSAELLPALADWAARTLRRQPELSRLRDAAFFRIGKDGTIDISPSARLMIESRSRL